METDMYIVTFTDTNGASGYFAYRTGNPADRAAVSLENKGYASVAVTWVSEMVEAA
jgi:hypothetical protein